VVKYEYRFVILEGAIGHHLNDKPHRQIITEHAADGWRLVQVLRSAESRRASNDVELIFERPVQSEIAGDGAQAVPI
jgi:hypothetical protein